MQLTNQEAGNLFLMYVKCPLILETKKIVHGLESVFFSHKCFNINLKNSLLSQLH